MSYLKYLIIIVMFNIPHFGISQSFVFCPKIKVENKINIEGDILLVFRDSRTYEQRLKEKCSKDEVFAAVATYIKTTFPNVKTTVLEDDQYSMKPNSNQITFKIDLKKYDVTFYTGMYVSYTKFLVRVHDLRDNEKILEFEFNGKGAQFNTMGKSSGKKASKNSFNRAMNEFTLIIEKVIDGNTDFDANIVQPKEEITQQKEIVTQSKADKLRELKKLLDEDILTQEEFEIEKKKILDKDNK